MAKTLGYRSIVLALATGLWTAGAVSGAQKSAFTQGEMEFDVGNQHVRLPLSKLADASSLMTIGKGEFILGLVYPGEKGQIPGLPIAPNSRFAIHVSGPGKADKSAIQNFVVQTDLVHPWGFTRDKDDCVFDLTRVDQDGVAGTVTCKTPVPFSGMKFTASR